MIEILRLCHVARIFGAAGDERLILTCGLGAQVFIFNGAQDGFRQRGWVTRINQQAVDAVVDPLADGVQVARDGEASASHALQQGVGRAVVRGRRDEDLRASVDFCHLRVRTPRQQFDGFFDAEFAQPVQGFGLSGHPRADKMRVGNFFQHERDGAKKCVIANVVLEAAWVEDDRLLHGTRGREENLRADAAVAGRDQRGLGGVESPGAGEADVALAVRVQGVGREHRPAGVKSHQRRGRRVQGEVVAPNRDDQRDAQSGVGGQHPFVGNPQGVDKIGLHARDDFGEPLRGARDGQRAEPVAQGLAQGDEARVSRAWGPCGLPIRLASGLPVCSTGASAKSDGGRFQSHETRERVAGKGRGESHLIPARDPVLDPVAGGGGASVGQE